VLLVSQTGTSDSHNREKYYIDENIQKVSTFLNSLKIKPQKLVLPSSRAVYGNGFSKLENGTIISNGIRSRKDLESGFFSYNWEKNHNGVYLPHDIELPSNPTSIYGVTKLAQEGLCHSILPTKDIDYTILRLQNVIGPYQSPLNPYTGLMCWFIDAALKNKTISVFENGEIWRDFVDVRDVCKAITTGFTNKIKISDVGSGYPTNLEDFAANIVSIVNSKSKIIKVDEYRLGDVRWAASKVNFNNIDFSISSSIEDYIKSIYYK
jgi:dTDP-L-rhamnose 4-epimerase